VLSNVPFLICGALGLDALRGGNISTQLGWAAVCSATAYVFVGVVIVKLRMKGATHIPFSNNVCNVCSALFCTGNGRAQRVGA
jgi:hypothetical protein